MHEHHKNPEHYRGKIEPLDVIEAWVPSWPPAIAHHLACVVKYAARCARKGDLLGDLVKARQYLDRAIALVSEPEAAPTPAVEPWPDLPPVTGMEPPKPVPAWVLPFVERPGHYAHAKGQTVGPADSASDALELLTTTLGWGAGERHAAKTFEVRA